MGQKMWRRLKRGGLGLAALCGALWLGNTSIFMTAQGPVLLLAHRGVYQSYDRTGLTNDTCTATRILEPVQPLIENTIASMQRAFDAGADIVELDVHRTTDGTFAVFHDWTLDCRTDGTGETRAQSMAALKTLDVGYGYTADGGETFPLRGRGVGLMPSFDEVAAAFPEGKFFVNFKSNDPADGAAFAALIAARGDMRAVVWDVYGGAQPVAAVTEAVAGLRGASKPVLKSCLMAYAALGWSGFVPPACRDTILILPSNVAPALWGWPHRFAARIERAGSTVILRGRYEGGTAGGIDTDTQLRWVPDGFAGVIWTDDIQTIAPLIRR